MNRCGWFCCFVCPCIYGITKQLLLWAFGGFIVNLCSGVTGTTTSTIRMIPHPVLFVPTAANNTASAYACARTCDTAAFLVARHRTTRAQELGPGVQAHHMTPPPRVQTPYTEADIWYV